MPALSVNNSASLLPKNFIDVRTRMLICLVCSAGIIFIQSSPALGVLALASLIYALAHGRVRVLAVTWCGVGVMFAIAMGCIRIMLIFWPEIGEAGPGAFFNPFLRVLVLVNTVFALAVSSRIQDVMTGLKTLGLPFVIYLPASVMIRFIPEFINDVKLIRESMRIKGFNPGIQFVTLHPFLVVRLLVVPLTIRALRSADTLSVAAELKGMDANTPMTKMPSPKPGAWDIVATACVLVLTFGSIAAEKLF
ncbi:energy-coupling factor transporter transmembrane protein EcfT [Desulfobacter hydrogenophilus]|uniref:Energy-coupling factor transporter transmembrane protein EcfT n=1 Tax=Desulfobacter hydrogenophilus TaxID=2291 RepID=A0A328F911_9BACT|nr:energy-coupling factor transporter transmembrane component T [Desulfobacter hydrogenophilus]NDY74311.1 energy-coupling factor transporter transmembrane protein EcfT [Desulfobacter hydrogenophilus]QBH15179.1 energy-coupling factor transporter transmembrane protein EcfT [Desulfobacter hydrogenophilus]RAM00130.1 energy-coupling factor transporter transmembrane protein EcfT [Desulfobacter hydrogenophilus]